MVCHGVALGGRRRHGLICRENVKPGYTKPRVDKLRAMARYRVSRGRCTAISLTMAWMPTLNRRSINCWEVDVKGLTNAAGAGMHRRGPLRTALRWDHSKGEKCSRCKPCRTAGQTIGSSIRVRWLGSHSMPALPPRPMNETSWNVFAATSPGRQ